jgi:hypothetical protein
MLTIKPFDWRKLTPLSKIEHRLDADGALLLRGADPDAEPLTTARVRDGKGGFVERSLHTHGFVWTRPDDGDGWLLRTTGEPITMTHTLARWAWPVSQASAELLVDERFLLITIGCEVGDASPDSSGRVPAPRTEIGYPKRSGESDPGDGARDAEDWAAFVAAGKRGTTHSSHGLMQTLVSTAVGVRPDLFAGVDPAQFRDVLAEPESSIACGAAYVATFPAAVRSDPLAARFQYGAGSVRASSSNAWGAVLFDELVPLAFVALWNDLACVRAEDCAVPAQSVPHAPAPTSETTAWLFAAVSCFALAIAASFAASQPKYRRAFERLGLRTRRAA